MMDYENIKNLRRKFTAGDLTLGSSEQTPKHTRASSLDSAQSVSYQTFYVEEGSADPPPGMVTQLQEQPQLERRRAVSVNTPYYSYPQSVKVSNKVSEEGYAYATTAHTSSLVHEEQAHESSSQLPPISSKLPPPSVTAVGDYLLPVAEGDHESVLKSNGNTHTHTSSSQPLEPIRNSKPAVTGDENSIDGRRPIASGNSRHQTGSPSASGVSVRPLVMKMLPLYLCAEDGKVYADQNAASIPTHHLVEVNQETMKDMAKLIPQPPIQTSTQLNPIYETVPKGKFTNVDKAPVISDEPRGNKDEETPSPSDCGPSIVQLTTYNDEQPFTSSDVPQPAIDERIEGLTAVVSHDHEAKELDRVKIHSQSMDGGMLHGSQVVILPEQERSGLAYYIFEGTHSYLYFTIVASIVVGLCLDLVVLLSCFLPALWFANKASKNKHLGNQSAVKKYSRRAIILNITGAVSHILFLFVVVIVFFVAIIVSLR